MHICYHDILSLSNQSPEWWLNGVPRFIPFEPHNIDIYADQAALILVKSQSDGRTYKVGVFTRSYNSKDKSLSQQIECYNSITFLNQLPNDGKDIAGPTMTPLQIKVIEFWKRKDDVINWERQEQYEVELIDYNEEYN